MTFSAIWACYSNGLIGNGDKLAHQSATEMMHFTKLTLNKTIIVGSNTWNPYIFPLRNRKHILLSKRKDTPVGVSSQFDNFRDLAKIEGDYMVIGGGQVYEQFIFSKLVSTVHMSILNGTTDVENPVYMPFDIDINEQFVIFSKNEEKVIYTISDVKRNDEFTYYILEFFNIEDNQFAFVMNALTNGTTYKKESRSGSTSSVYDRNNLKFDARYVFPLSSIRKQHFKSIAAEMLFFLSGRTDTKELEEQKVNIWKKNTSREALDSLGLDYAEGEMGPSYGWQMRHFGAKYPNTDGGVDQIKNLIEEIKKNPNSRRLIVTLWNPVDLEQMSLPPCMFLYQFIVRGELIDIIATQRSSDFPLAGAWNIAAAALLLYIIAHCCDLHPGTVRWNCGDLHMYENQRDQVIGIIDDFNLPNFPRLLITGPKNIDELRLNHFKLIGYECEKKISVTMNG